MRLRHLAPQLKVLGPIEAIRSADVLTALRKVFFFEKKNQKTFDCCRGLIPSAYLKR
jgi:hypothetical protein